MELCSEVEVKLGDVSSTLDKPNLWLSDSLDGGLQDQLDITKVSVIRVALHWFNFEVCKKFNFLILGNFFLQVAPCFLKLYKKGCTKNEKNIPPSTTLFSSTP